MNDSSVIKAIEMSRKGNPDALLLILTGANTPEAQRLMRELQESNGKQTQERQASWREFVDKVIEQTWR